MAVAAAQPALVFDEPAVRYAVATHARGAVAEADAARIPHPVGVVLDLKRDVLVLAARRAAPVAEHLILHGPELLPAHGVLARIADGREEVQNERPVAVQDQPPGGVATSALVVGHAVEDQDERVGGVAEED